MGGLGEERRLLVSCLLQSCLGSLVGLKDIKCTARGPGELGQMGAWRGQWPQAQISKGSQPAPPPRLQPCGGQVGLGGGGGGGLRLQPTQDLPAVRS